MWALRLTQIEVFKFPNNYLQRKTEDQYIFDTKRYLEFNKRPVAICNNKTF